MLCAIPLMKSIEVQFFDLFSGPICLAKKPEARLERRVIPETGNLDQIAQLFPSIMEKQLLNDKFERQAMKWIIFLPLVSHAAKIGLCAESEKTKAKSFGL